MHSFIKIFTFIPWNPPGHEECARVRFGRGSITDIEMEEEDGYA
jgi:hypothetical protein